MVGGWLGADYLSAGWVADGYLRKQEFTPTPGAWANQGYLSKRWVSESWLHRDSSVVTAAVEVQNVPGLALAKLDGSSKVIIRVNATQPSVPLTPLSVVVGAFNGINVSVTSVPSVGLNEFNATVNGGVAQVADVSVTVEVASTFGYEKVVSATVAELALAAIDAIVTTGTNVNVPGTKASLSLAVLGATAKGNTQARAITSLPVPLVTFGAVVVEGLAVQVDAGFSIPLTAIAVAVDAVSPQDTGVVATLASLAMDTLDTSIVATNTPEPINHLPGNVVRRLRRRYRGREARVARDGW